MQRFMAEQLFDCKQIGTVFVQMGCKGMPEGMTVQSWIESKFITMSHHLTLQHTGLTMFRRILFCGKKHFKKLLIKKMEISGFNIVPKLHLHLEEMQMQRH